MSEDNSGLNLTRRRLLGGVAATGAAATGAGAGTWALFQDTETSSGNTIDAGTLDLVVTNDQIGDGVSGTWTIDNAKPGDSVLADVTLTNSGTLEADHVEFDVSVDETETEGPNGNNASDTKPSTADGMAEQFEVTLMTYDGTNILDDLDDANGNGILDISDLAQGNDGALDDLTPPPAADGTSESLSLEFRWAHDSEFDNTVSGINNDYQGDTLDITVTMALHQKDNQDI